VEILNNTTVGEKRSRPEHSFVSVLGCHNRTGSQDVSSLCVRGGGGGGGGGGGEGGGGGGVLTNLRNLFGMDSAGASKEEMRCASKDWRTPPDKEWPCQNLSSGPARIR